VKIPRDKISVQGDLVFVFHGDMGLTRQGVEVLFWTLHRVALEHDARSGSRTVDHWSWVAGDPADLGRAFRDVSIPEASYGRQDAVFARSSGSFVPGEERTGARLSAGHRPFLTLGLLVVGAVLGGLVTSSLSHPPLSREASTFISGGWGS